MQEGYSNRHYKRIDSIDDACKALIEMIENEANEKIKYSAELRYEDFVISITKDRNRSDKRTDTTNTTTEPVHRKDSRMA